MTTQYTPAIGNVTITASGIGPTIYPNSSNAILIGGGGGGSTFVPSGGYLAGYGPTPSAVLSTTGQGSMQVSGDAEFRGDVKIQGISIVETLNKINQRLCILQVDPKKLDKYQALQQAYEHYRTLEALCIEETGHE
jgi:hypothetical protein